MYPYTNVVEREEIARETTVVQTVSELYRGENKPFDKVTKFFARIGYRNNVCVTVNKDYDGVIGYRDWYAHTGWNRAGSQFTGLCNIHIDEQQIKFDEYADCFIPVSMTPAVERTPIQQILPPLRYARVLRQMDLHVGYEIFNDIIQRCTTMNQVVEVLPNTIRTTLMNNSRELTKLIPKCAASTPRAHYYLPEKGRKILASAGLQLMMYKGMTGTAPLVIDEHVGTHFRTDQPFFNPYPPTNFQSLGELKSLNDDRIPCPEVESTSGTTSEDLTTDIIDLI